MIYCHNLFVEMIGPDGSCKNLLTSSESHLPFQEAPPPITSCQHLEVMPTPDHWHKRLSPPTSCLTSWVELCRFSVEKRIPNSKKYVSKLIWMYLFIIYFGIETSRKMVANQTLTRPNHCRGCVVSSSPRRSTTTMVCAPSSRCSWQPETSNVTCVNLFG